MNLGHRALDSNVHEQFVNNWNRLYGALKSIQFERKRTANPSVFEYGVAHLERKHVYLHVFCERFPVRALELPKGTCSGMTTYPTT